jgi:hypothetical protein
LALLRSALLLLQQRDAAPRTRRSPRHSHPSAPTLWRDAPFSKLQALPTNARPVTDRSWPSRDDALLDVAEQISAVVKTLRIQLTLNEADRLTDEQHYEEALVLYDQVLRLEPDSALTHLHKGSSSLEI